MLTVKQYRWFNMKKIMITILMLMAVTTPLSAVTITRPVLVGGPVSVTASGSAAVTEITVAEQTSTDGGHRIYITTGDTCGQSFTVSQNCLLTSITIGVDTLDGAADCIMRVGTSQDLSATYLEEASNVPTTTGDFTYIFAGTTSLSTGTTYYFMIRNADALFSDLADIEYQSTDLYANGTRQDGDDWSCSDDTGDLRFTVKGNV